MEEKNTYPNYPRIGDQFQEMGKTFEEARSKVPSLTIGKGEPRKQDPFVDKMRKWLLIGLTVLIAGLAAILIVWRIILRFI